MAAQGARSGGGGKYPTRPGRRARPARYERHSNRPHEGPGAVAELASAADDEAEVVVRADAREKSPEPAAAPPGLSPKGTRDSEQYRASKL
jgi:hypothetical protein